jgi:hypothetical protein
LKPTWPPNTPPFGLMVLLANELKVVTGPAGLNT